jgi:hypothetical protein
MNTVDRTWQTRCWRFGSAAIAARPFTLAERKRPLIFGCTPSGLAAIRPLPQRGTAPCAYSAVSLHSSRRRFAVRLIAVFTRVHPRLLSRSL